MDHNKSFQVFSGHFRSFFAIYVTFLKKPPCTLSNSLSNKPQHHILKFIFIRIRVNSNFKIKDSPAAEREVANNSLPISSSYKLHHPFKIIFKQISNRNFKIRFKRTFSQCWNLVNNFNFPWYSLKLR